MAYVSIACEVSFDESACVVYVVDFRQRHALSSISEWLPLDRNELTPLKHIRGFRRDASDKVASIQCLVLFQLDNHNLDDEVLLNN